MYITNFLCSGDIAVIKTDGNLVSYTHHPADEISVISDEYCEENKAKIMLEIDWIYPTFSIWYVDYCLLLLESFPKYHCDSFTVFHHLDLCFPTKVCFASKGYLAISGNVCDLLWWGVAILSSRWKSVMPLSILPYTVFPRHIWWL